MKWPVGINLTIGTGSRVRVRPGMESHTQGQNLRPATTGFISACDIMENKVTVMVNPAIVWVGTYQELEEMWEKVTSDTPLTF